ncbi:hypothetical protein J6590_002070 [Homalodisca vitripennis]|nr:hypothetical protein J6590_002070 [Homalodisca vitripennis]
MPIRDLSPGSTIILFVTLLPDLRHTLAGIELNTNKSSYSLRLSWRYQWAENLVSHISTERTTIILFGTLLPDLHHTLAGIELNTNKSSYSLRLSWRYQWAKNLGEECNIPRDITSRQGKVGRLRVLQQEGLETTS